MNQSRPVIAGIGTGTGAGSMSRPFNSMPPPQRPLPPINPHTSNAASHLPSVPPIASSTSPLIRTSSLNSSTSGSHTPNAAAAAASSLSSFDDEFGDGSDLADFDEPVISNAIIANVHTVKTEPNLNAPNHPQSPSSAFNHNLQNEAEPQSAARIQQSMYPSSNGRPVSSVTVQFPPQPPPSTSAGINFPASKQLELERTIAQLQAANSEKNQLIAEKVGESKLLRNKLEAHERQRVNQAVKAATATTTASTTASSTSSSAFPSSQIPSSQSRSADAAMQRVRSQLHSLQAAKESSDIQCSEYAKENQQLKRRLEAMEKLQQQQAKEIKNKQPQIQSNASALASNSSNLPSSVPSVALTGAPQQQRQNSVGQSNNPSVPQHTRGTSGMLDRPPSLPIESGKHHPIASVVQSTWHMPQFLSNFNSNSNFTAHDSQLITQMQSELKQLLAQFTPSILTTSSPTPTVKPDPATSSPVELRPPHASSNVLVEGGANLTEALQLTLIQRSPLTCALQPLRHMIAASLVHPIFELPSLSNKRSMLTASHERNVKAKLESGAAAANATSSSSLESPQPPAALMMDVKRTNQQTKEWKSLRQMQILLLRLLHFAMTRSADCATQVFEECLPTKKVASFTPLPGVSNPQDLWKWMPSSEMRKAGDVEDESKSAALTPSPSNTNTLNWQQLLTKLFDSLLPRLYSERSDRVTSIGPSSTNFAVVEAIISVLEVISSLHDRSHLNISNLSSVPRSTFFDTWLPRIVILVSRIHGNTPVVILSKLGVEQRIQMTMSRIVARGCHQAPRAMGAVILPVSQVNFPAHLKSLATDGNSPCSCSLGQLLLIGNLRLSSSPLSSDCNRAQLLLDLLSSSHACWNVERGEHMSTSICTIHGKDVWGEREADLALMHACAALFSIPFAQMRLLVHFILQSVDHMQRITQKLIHQLGSAVEKSDDQSVPIATRALSSTLDRLSTECHASQLATALSLLLVCVGVNVRSWHELQLDPDWTTAIQSSRSESAADIRPEVLFVRLQEACVAVQQCHLQIKGIYQQLKECDELSSIRSAAEQGWVDSVFLTTQLLHWFQP